MPIEMIFIGVLESIAQDQLKRGIHEAIRAMTEQEILETDVNRLVSQPFRSANNHLQNATLETVSGPRKHEHIEYARLDFIKASDLDAPLPAARAAFYVGLCHHLCDERKHEVFWYERSLSMLSELEKKLENKLTTIDLFVKTTAWKNPLAALSARAYRAAVEDNLAKQLNSVRAHKNAVHAVIENGASKEGETIKKV